MMGKNQNSNFSKRARCPILKFLVVIREVILQKMAPILAPVIFFSVFSLISHCAPYVLKRYDIPGDLLFSYRATPFTSYCKTGKGAFLAYNYLQEKLSLFQCWMQSCSLF